MGKVGRLYVEGRSGGEESTRNRYKKALEQFWSFLREEGRRIPDQAHELDTLLCIYLDACYVAPFKGLECA